MTASNYSLTNGTVTIVVAALGAELQSLVHHDNKLEYMWDANPQYWAKRSPVLFPVIGGLKDKSYSYAGKQYALPRHGFARERVFTLKEQTEVSLTFSLEADASTLAVYPFKFEFLLQYRLEGASVHVTYTVINTGAEVLPFSVGAHPAFRVPITADTSFEDYYLAFNKPENGGLYVLDDKGLVATTPLPFFNNSTTLPLTKELFYKDALIFKNMASDSITIKSDSTDHGLELTYPGFDYMGIWQAKDAPFVCIEPWCGIADMADTTGNIMDKEGINFLAPQASFERTWTVRVF